MFYPENYRTQVTDCMISGRHFSLIYVKPCILVHRYQRSGEQTASIFSVYGAAGSPDALVPRTKSNDHLQPVCAQHSPNPDTGCTLPVRITLIKDVIASLTTRQYLDVVTKCRSQWPRGRRNVSAAARLLGLRVRFPPGDMDVCLLLVLCIVRWKSRPDLSSRGFLPSVLRLCAT
jgi:hypothetical protein